MSWKHIRGHDFIIRAFALAARKNRIGHAYLFVGPSGVGKHLFARELAKTLLCESNRERQDRTGLTSPARQEFEACDQCASCRLIEASTHPDLFMVSRPEDALEFPVEVMRNLETSLAMKPARGGRKIAILDDANDLNQQSANCFLKTLEEPPPGSILILIGGASSDQQLATIVSRCQVIRFAPLATPILREILQEHGITDSQQQSRLLRLGAGSAGQALALQDEALWQFRKLLLEGLSAEKVDSVSLAKEWMRFLEAAGKDGAIQRRTASLVVQLLVGILTTALHFSLGIEVAGLDAEESRLIKKIAQRFGPERIMDWIDRAGKADYHIDRRVQLVLAVEGLMDTLGREMSAAVAQA
jgi:DNA polymerase-3 subunit delta'